MKRVEIERSAQTHMESIFAHSRDRWDHAQASSYTDKMFSMMRAIAADQFPWRRIHSSFGINGYVRKCGRHFIYWRCGADDVVRIVAVLHERMHQSARLHEALDDEP